MGVQSTDDYTIDYSSAFTDTKHICVSVIKTILSGLIIAIIIGVTMAIPIITIILQIDTTADTYAPAVVVSAYIITIIEIMSINPNIHQKPDGLKLLARKYTHINSFVYIDCIANLVFYAIATAMLLGNKTSLYGYTFVIVITTIAFIISTIARCTVLIGVSYARDEVKSII